MLRVAVIQCLSDVDYVAIKHKALINLHYNELTNAKQDFVLAGVAPVPVNLASKIARN